MTLYSMCYHWPDYEVYCTILIYLIAYAFMHMGLLLKGNIQSTYIYNFFVLFFIFILYIHYYNFSYVTLTQSFLLP